MVYAVRTNDTFCVKGPVKKKRIKGEFTKQMEEFAKTHTASFRLDKDGNLIASVEEIHA